MNATETSEKFLISAENMPLLEADLAKLNKRAEKLGLPPVGLTKHEIVVKEHDENGVKEYEEFIEISVYGEAPVIEGWYFVATLEHEEEGVILRRIPTFSEKEVDLTEYRHATPENCDHCHQRRRRNDTYIVQHEDGTLKQVGSSCLKDFTGHKSPEQLARFATYLRDFYENLEGGGYTGSGPRSYDPQGFLTQAALMIRKYGWVSRKAEWETGARSTASAAEQNMFARFPTREDAEEQDSKLAADALDWVRSLTEEDLKNDYLWNLYVALKNDHLKTRQFGIAASAIYAYNKHMEHEIQRREARSAQGDFVGEEKEKVVLESVTLARVKWIEGYMGDSVPLYSFVTPENSSVKWFSSRNLGLEVGEKYSLKGTIKKLEDHPQYGKSTYVTRCTVEAL